MRRCSTRYRLLPDIRSGEREREVLRLISEGMTTRQIAEQMNLSEHTVHTHPQRIMDKRSTGTAWPL